MSPRRSVLVTGGAGFIGSHLVDRLLGEGCSVTVIDDRSTGSLENLRAAAANPSFRFVEAKVSECGDLDRIVREASTVFHLAAAVGVDLVVKSPIRTIHTNLTETGAILEAAGRHRVPVLVTSTSEVYGKSTKPAFAEDDDLLIGPPTLGRWSYACSKLMDEFLAMAYAQEHGLRVVVARLFNTVGPRQTGAYGMVLPRFIEAARAGLPLRVFGDGLQSRCFCHVRDTVEALVRLDSAEAAAGGVFNVGGTEEVTIRGLAELVIRTLGSASTIEHVPYNRAYAAGFEDMQRRVPVVAKLEQATGFKPRTSLVDIIRSAAGILPAA